jgi:hypothetical protein
LEEKEGCSRKNGVFKIAVRRDIKERVLVLEVGEVDLYPECLVLGKVRELAMESLKTCGEEKRACRGSRVALSLSTESRIINGSSTLPAKNG